MIEIIIISLIIYRYHNQFEEGLIYRHKKWMKHLVNKIYMNVSTANALFYKIVYKFI
jgi:hypothetical protein